MKTEEKVARKIKNLQGYVDFLRKNQTSEQELKDELSFKIGY